MDFNEALSCAIYTHKLTKEIILLRTVSNIFTSVDETDVEIYMEQTDPILKNYQDEKNLLYVPFNDLLEVKGKEWCISSRNVWGIPVPICYVIDENKFANIVKKHPSLKGVKLTKCMDG